MRSKVALIPKIFVYKLNHFFGWPKVMPINLTLSISNACMSRCRTCNIWQKKCQELDISEWEKILKSIGSSPYWITISGGEPFLQNHLVDLIKLIYQYNQPAIINIPTNAILSDIIPKKVEEMIKACPDTQFVINISVDGIGDRHDAIRGVKGNFEKVIKTFNSIKKLKIHNKNLNLGLHTVVSNFNVDNLAELFDWALAQQPDQYIMEIAEERVELDTVGMDITPSLEKFKKTSDLLMDKLKSQKFKGLSRTFPEYPTAYCGDEGVSNKSFRRNFRSLWKVRDLSRITEAFRKEYYKLVQEYLTDKKQPLPCFAGRASAQIYCDGTIWPCCVRADDLGNLREYDYDFKKIWFSKKSETVRKSISNKECACPLANAAYTNMLVNYRTLFKVIFNL